MKPVSASRVKLQRVSGPSGALRAKRNLCFDSKSPRKSALASAAGTATTTWVTPKKAKSETPRKQTKQGMKSHSFMALVRKY